MPRRLIAALALLLLYGCTGAPGPCALPPGPCAPRSEHVMHLPALHHEQGKALEWNSNPPATGPHYNVWAPWARAYDQPVPRGNWVHNLEHGGVVLLYRCPCGCPEVVERLTQLGRSLPQDSRCMPPINARWLVTPDPLLPEDTLVAAAAWGFTYRANCVDEASLRAFINEHYAKSDEDICADGLRVW